MLDCFLFDTENEEISDEDWSGLLDYLSEQENEIYDEWTE